MHPSALCYSHVSAICSFFLGDFLPEKRILASSRKGARLEPAYRHGLSGIEQFLKKDAQKPNKTSFLANRVIESVLVCIIDTDNVQPEGVSPREACSVCTARFMSDFLENQDVSDWQQWR